MHKHLLPYEIVDKLKCSQVVKRNKKFSTVTILRFAMYKIEVAG